MDRKGKIYFTLELFVTQRRMQVLSRINTKGFEEFLCIGKQFFPSWHFIASPAFRKTDHQPSYGFHHAFRIIKKCLGYGMGSCVFLQYDAPLLHSMKKLESVIPALKNKSDRKDIPYIISLHFHIFT